MSCGTSPSPTLTHEGKKGQSYLMVDFPESIR